MNLTNALSVGQQKAGKISHRLFYSKLIWKLNAKPPMTILDVGCGQGSQVIRELRRNFPDRYIVGCDGFLQYIKKNKEKHLYDECILADVRYLPFRDASFEAVFCLEVIERLDKKEGWQLLSHIGRLATVKVSTSSPAGLMFQDESDGNINHIHKSGWFPSDFKKEGFQVYGSVGPFFLKGYNPRSESARYLISVAGLISAFLEPLYYFVPDLALIMICVKRVTPKSTLE
jgi:SAM-dependent methyltransferase